jgi:acetyl-CoA carboxylase biotin carboxyl carrier protein
MTIDINKIEKIMSLMEKHGFDVLQTESKGEKISLARNAAQASFFHAPQAAHHGTPVYGNKVTTTEPTEFSPAAMKQTTAESKPTATEQPAAGEVIKSPFVGTFYRSSNPSNPPFVEVGSKIKKGQSLCIVEAMKLMNEIESEVEGEVVAILVENGKPVEFGTPLFIIKTVG